MPGSSYNKHVSYRRVDPRTGKMLYVQGGRSDSFNVKEEKVNSFMGLLGLTRQEFLDGMVPKSFVCENTVFFPEESGFMLKADIYKKGKKYGYFSRRITINKNKNSVTMYNIDFKLNADVRQKGFGSVVIARQLDTLEKVAQKFKTAQVRLLAMSDESGSLVGAYVWPKLGFTVEPKSFKSLLDFVRKDGKYICGAAVAKILTKTKNITEFIAHPEGRKLLLSESVGLDCYTDVGSKAYTQLRQNLQKIVLKNKRENLVKALSPGYMKHKGYVRIVNGKAQYVKGGKPANIEVFGKLPKKDPVLAAAHKHILKQGKQFDEESVHHALRDHVESNYDGTDAKKELMVRQLLEAMHKHGILSVVENSVPAKTKKTEKIEKTKDKSVSLVGVSEPTADDRSLVREWVIASNKSRAAIAYRLAANAILGVHKDPKDALARTFVNSTKNIEDDIAIEDRILASYGGVKTTNYFSAVHSKEALVKKLNLVKTKFKQMVDEELQNIPERVEMFKRIAKHSQAAYAGESTVTLYRGITAEQLKKYKGKNIDLACDTVASFTDNRGIAETFVDKGGAVIAVQVPVSSIVMSHKAFPVEAALAEQTRATLDTEQEVVILVNGVIQGKKLAKSTNVECFRNEDIRRARNIEINKIQATDYTFVPNRGHTHNMKGHTLPLDLSHIYGKHISGI